MHNDLSLYDIEQLERIWNDACRLNTLNLLNEKQKRKNLKAILRAKRDVFVSLRSSIHHRNSIEKVPCLFRTQLKRVDRRLIEHASKLDNQLKQLIHRVTLLRQNVPKQIELNYKQEIHVSSDSNPHIIQSNNSSTSCPNRNQDDKTIIPTINNELEFDDIIKKWVYLEKSIASLKSQRLPLLLNKAQRFENILTQISKPLDQTERISQRTPQKVSNKTDIPQEANKQSQDKQNWYLDI